MKCIYRLNINHKRFNTVMSRLRKDEKDNLIHNLQIEGTEKLSMLEQREKEYNIITFENKPKQNPLSLF